MSGLRLEPGDYEFMVLKEEVERGATIEEMENHYIREEDDRLLREGKLDEAESILNGLKDNPSVSAAVQDNLTQIQAKRDE